MLRLLLQLRLKLLLLQRDGHAHVPHLQEVAGQAIQLGRALGAARRPTLAEHEERVLWRDVDGHLALLLPHREMQRHQTRSLLAGPDVHHHAGVDLEPSADLCASHKILSLQILHTLQLPGGQLDNRALHEM